MKRSILNPAVSDILATCSPDVYTEVCMSDCYELAHNARLLKHSLGGILDIGAHIGCFSAMAATLWPDTPVYAVEPHGPNFSVLSAVAEKYTNLSPIHAAIGNGYAPAAVTTDVSNACTFVATKHSPDKNIPALSLAELASQVDLRNPYFVKIDIEGAETFLFDDDASTDVLRDALLWVIELHCFDPAKPHTRHNQYTPTSHYLACREVLVDTWRWLHSFTDCQSVVLNMSQPNLWIAHGRQLHTVPW